MISLRHNWGKLALFVILSIIILINCKPESYILGNDNYSPEENPFLSVTRYLSSPAWREYRGLGVPSDTEQTDIFRSLFFWLLHIFGLPLWLISQSSVWFTFFIGSWSTAHLATTLLRKLTPKNHQLMFLIAGVCYLTNLVTIWLFFSPLKPFIFVWGFLPFFLWQCHRFLIKPATITFLTFLLSLAALTTSAIIPTIFFIATVIFAIFLIIFRLQSVPLPRLLFVFTFFCVFQLFWLTPFLLYVHTNAASVQNTYINRMITPNTIQAEIQYNTLLNIPRFFTSWLDTKNNDGSFLFPHAQAYQQHPFLIIISFLVPLLSLTGTTIALYKKHWPLVILGVMYLGTIWLITNPDFLNHLPFYQQVLRWPSSKFWPALLLSSSILAPYALLYLTRHLIIIAAVVISLLLFVFPFWRGQLVSPTNLISIPQPYLSLQQFLLQNYPRERLYPAPEANTLYFRNYSWSFYGSVFLSYLLPNPLMEKALVTGSSQNEQAQKLLTNAYYSENPLLFAKALNLYRVSLVLSDKSVTHLPNGYRYNWDIHTQVVGTNPYLEKIWEQDFLALYQVKLEPPTATQWVYPNHNWLTLQSVHLLSNNQNQFLSQPNQVGTIYPLALTPNQLNHTTNQLEFTHTYTGPSASFIPKLPLNSDQLPTQAKYQPQTGTITLKSALPELRLNQQPLLLPTTSDTLTTKLPSQAKFITLDSLVWDFHEQPIITTETPSNAIRAWTNSQDLKPSTFIPITKDSLVSITLLAQSTPDQWHSVCVFSRRLSRCLNPNQNTWGEFFTKSLTLTLPEIVSAPDTLEIMLPTTTRYKVDSIRLWQQSTPLQLSRSTMPQASPTTFTLSPQDKITVSIPILTGPHTLHLQPTKLSTLPQVFDSGQLTPAPLGLTITAKQTSAGFYQEFPSFSSIHPLMLLAASNTHTQGIPLDLNFRDTKQDYKLYTNRLGFLTQSHLLETVLIPQTPHNFLFETYLFGQGNTQSVNTLHFLAVQPLPLEWLQLRFDPTHTPLIPEFTGLNQSAHPNWQAPPLTLNGWEQGSTANQPIFWPNYLSWAGYILNLILALASILWLILHHENSRNTHLSGNNPTKTT